MDATHGTVLGVGRNTHTPGYRPGTNLRTFTEHAAPTCSVHLCGVRADRCDLDHAIPYAAGGATCICNVRALCRTHRRLKTAGLITLTPAGPDFYAAHPDAPPGTLLLTTRAGLTYPTPPHAPLPVIEPAAPGPHVPPDDPPPF